MDDYKNSGSAKNYDDLDIERSTADDYTEPKLKYDKQSPEEKHLLKHCIVELDDGCHGYVFSYEEDERNVGSYFCHVCQTPMSSWFVVNQHISGKKHSANIQKSYHPRINFTRIVEEDPTVELQPGEPAPPGMEDMVEPKKCIIQSKLDAFKSRPLIGLEYLVELLCETTDPNYYCLLCNKQGVNNNIIIHVSSQQHYLKYLQKYFSNVYSALMLVPKTSEYKKGYSVVITRIVSHIESKFGRLKPRQCESESFFEFKKFELLKTIENEFHFRETINDDYVNMVDWTEMKRLQFCNEDSEVTPVSKGEDSAPTDKRDDSSLNKSLFNKAGRINVDKRQLRNKDRNLTDDEGKKVHDSSPDLIIVGETKKAPGIKKKSLDRKSFSSISTISSDSDRRLSRSRSNSRPRSRSKSSYRGRYRSPSDHRRRRRSKSRSPGVKRRRHYSPALRRHSRSYSRSPSRRLRSRSPSPRQRFQRYRRDRSPLLPYPRRRRSPSKSRSRSPKVASDFDQVLPRYFRHRRNFPDKPPPKDQMANKYKWEKFREELRVLSNESRDKLKYYEQNPEKHPQYPEEWKMFWNRRYKELQADGKDPAKHDFKPEWIVFWNKRMKEMNDTEFKEAKEKLKEKIGLKDDKHKNDNDNKLDEGLEKEKDVTVDDIKNTWRALTGSEIKEGARSPIPRIENDDLLIYEHFDSRHPELRMNSRPPPGARLGFIPYDDNAPRVVSVLRTITVLETQLGSLGPKVVSLLSKALAMEKVCENSSQEILCNEEHCVLFETVKEKLKGMLYAGLVDRNFVNLTKVALKNIEDLFIDAPKVCKRETIHSTVAPVSAPSSSLINPVTVPGVGTVDRVAIAQQIAGALIAQGKTDVTEEELEQLINAVVGMAQASSNSDAPITTAEYFKKVQNIDTGSNISVADSGALKQLQTAYDDDEKRPNEINIGPMSGSKAFVNKAGGSLKDLSDKDLKCLLNNFRDLSPNEQTKLIAYFKKLEATDPDRILELKKSIDMKSLLDPGVNKVSSGSLDSQLSPFSSRLGAINPVDESQKALEAKNDSDDDDDDDDYSYEDVYKAASEKVRQQELTQERKKIESVLAGIAEAAKKGDIANLSDTFQFSPSKLASAKGFDSPLEEDRQQVLKGRQSLDGVPQTPAHNLDNYSGSFYPQSTFQPVAVGNSSSQTTNYSVTDFNRSSGYSYNPGKSSQPKIFSSDSQQINSGNQNPYYSSSSDGRNIFDPRNRDYSFPSNTDALRSMPNPQNIVDPAFCNQNQYRNFSRY